LAPSTVPNTMRSFGRVIRIWNDNDPRIILVDAYTHDQRLILRAYI
jgi:hypothetical protein